MMTGMVRSGCYERGKKKKKKKSPCDQGLPDDIYFELTSQNTDLPPIRGCQTHRQAPEFSYKTRIINQKLEEKYSVF